MSTKEPVLWHNDFEIYRDYLDENFVWLALRRTEFEASPSEVRVKIPAAVWEVLRSAPSEDFDMLGLTDEQIAKRVHAAVAERLRDYDAERAGGEPRFAALFGALIFGDISDPPDKQIANGVEHYAAQRERQRGIVAKIAELRRETRCTARDGYSICAREASERESTRETVDLHELAARVLGSQESAERWMITPALAFDGARPGDLLVTPTGRERVREHLARVEGGIYT